MSRIDGWLRRFVAESNRIEGILREPTQQEMDATAAFLMLTEPTVLSLCELVSVFQPGNRIRDIPGLNVRVGEHVAPAGGPDIPVRLAEIVHAAAEIGSDPHSIHCEYETLHPFTDGNGRTGRALWLWMMLNRGSVRDRAMATELGFLHTFYYQTLARTHS